ncbi:hypothetical protein tpqmel_1058, partial [Candidatus Gastranaerophilus sp. (ex Termes propinquus)]
QTKRVAALQKLFEGLKSSAKIVYVDSSFDPKNIQQKIREKAAQEQEQSKNDGEGEKQPFAAPAQ